MRKIGKLPAAAAALSMAMAPLSAERAVAAESDDSETLFPLAFLGLEAAKGTTTTEGSAGKIETELLMTPLVWSAAKKLRQEIGTPVSARPGNGTPSETPAQPHAARSEVGTPKKEEDKSEAKVIVPILGTSAPNLQAYPIVSHRLRRAEVDLDGVGKWVCAAADKKDGKEVAAADSKEAGVDTSPQAILSTLAGLLKTDTTVSGIDIKAQDEMLLNALLAEKPNGYGWYVPGEKANFDGDDQSLQNRAMAILASLNAREGLKCKEDEGKKARLASARATMTALTAPGEKGAPSLLEQAMLLEDPASNAAYVLRVAMGGSGGTMVKAQNVWTTLGAEALSFSSGLTLSYRLVDPRDGTVKSSGMIVCAGQKRGFKKAHDASALTANDSDCQKL
jgi:hypothetical protein